LGQFAEGYASPHLGKYQIDGERSPNVSIPSNTPDCCSPCRSRGAHAMPVSRLPGSAQSHRLFARRPLLAPLSLHPLSPTGQQCVRACCPVTDNSSASTIHPSSSFLYQVICKRLAFLSFVLVPFCGVVGDPCTSRGQVSAQTSPLISTRSLPRPGFIAQLQVEFRKLKNRVSLRNDE
jgi:hypothetical protein